ncbi:FAD-dependent oxidoreductase [Thalassiella azotivora]
MSERVVVVGAGVIGLSCAVRLAEAGYDVHVLARDLPAETTSAVAAALWMPYRAEPLDEVTRWALETHTELLRLNDGAPGAGVLVREGVVLLREEFGPRAPRPDWADALGDVVPLTPVLAPCPGYEGGWAALLPVVETPRYLAHLAARLEAAGGTLTRMPLAELPQRGLVVNASGVAARALARDQDVHAVRGQVVVVDNPGLTRWVVDQQEDDGELMYVVPRRDDVVVGGSAQVGDWGTTPDPALAERILARAVAAVPALAGARVRRHRVGLRPARSAVRVATEHRADGAVVHCYGHGGCGVTVSWGCAADVVEQVRALA